MTRAPYYDQEYERHIKAGLVYAGPNEDGENEWIGTDEQWSKYNELTEEENY